ncbi:GGDEF domain-containing protein, diguanylate cyclase (c-di-GMP synthetase) or its enzymatically inactive variants [Lachnobacterium bovis]|uniref:GGDEF domain-containing protein, diguanylate cyclase (C-di-GMP synthetase) or its enzymatically inactive variants n=2 Tax=Lachnobacterium bovis TaxID=140626 RepID=A0A1H9P883_9FIRM|nr:GGDEF domain-containing protein, diguanylate cyclase (c-di-GMP synthetase) or its enzymatically inactive variants [Lachnobacterium bovis]
MMYLALYIEISVLCIVLLIIVALQSSVRLNDSGYKRSYINAVVCTMSYVSVDCVSRIIHYGNGQLNMDLLYVFKSMYFISETVMGYLWFVYFEFVLDKGEEYTKNKEMMDAVALFFIFVNFFICVINSQTGFIYYYDKNMEYHIGNCYVLQIVFAYLYLITGSFQAFCMLIFTEKNIERTKYGTLALFPYIPIIFSIIQMRFNWMPLISVSVTVTSLLIFFATQEDLISKDAVTSLNNNREFLRRMYAEVEKLKDDNFVVIYLLVFEINKLDLRDREQRSRETGKKLKAFAKILEDVSVDANRKAIVGRIKGNEFALFMKIYHKESEKEKQKNEERTIIRELKIDLNNAIARYNAKEEVDYNLDVNIGFARYKIEKNGVNNAFLEAEGKMYKDRISKEQIKRVVN